jgi:hypothetical protein
MQIVHSEAILGRRKEEGRRREGVRRYVQVGKNKSTALGALQFFQTYA